MSLPYLSYDRYRNNPEELGAVADSFIELVLEDRALLCAGYPPRIELCNWQVLLDWLLEVYLKRQKCENFNFAKTRELTEKLRKLKNWHRISFVLDRWILECLIEPFVNRFASSRKGPVLKSGIELSNINPELFQFACYIAVGYRKYGPEFKYMWVNEIFETVTLLGSDIPANLKKSGTGSLPKSITEFSGGGVSCKANDAFGTIRIIADSETEENYRSILSYLHRLLEAEFPHSYAIDFRSPSKSYLAVKELPKKGVHQLFANAVAYTDLRPLIERYARTAMREFELYTNMSEENPVLPGTFAVFALTLVDDAYVPLALDYLRIVDGEHQSIHGSLVHAYIARHGFTANAISLLVACARNIQNMSPKKSYATLIEKRESLELLTQALRTLEDDALPGELSANALWAHDAIRTWQNALSAIWGSVALRHPEELVESAPDGLSDFYRAILV